MKVKVHKNAQGFLDDTRAVLERHESSNSLMLGICDQLVHHPTRFTADPYLMTIQDEQGLILAAIMTPPHNLILFSNREALELGINRLIDDLVQAEWQVPGVIANRKIAKLFADIWNAKNHQKIEFKRRSTLYELREAKSIKLAPGHLRLANLKDLDLIAAWWQDFVRVIDQPITLEKAQHSALDRINHGDIFIWDLGVPVSMAMKVRPTRSGGSLSLVYTPPEYRNNGYATTFISELSKRLLAEGWEYCALFTDATNSPANHVYERVGYLPIDFFDEYSFSSDSSAID